jgi:hypothetical protein
MHALHSTAIGPPVSFTGDLKDLQDEQKRAQVLADGHFTQEQRDLVQENVAFAEMGNERIRADKEKKLQWELSTGENGKRGPKEGGKGINIITVRKSVKLRVPARIWNKKADQQNDHHEEVVDEEVVDEEVVDKEVVKEVVEVEQQRNRPRRAVDIYRQRQKTRERERERERDTRNKSS